RELRDRRRLSRSVDAEDEDDGGRRRRACERGAGRTQLLGHDALEARRIDRGGATESLDRLIRCGDAKIGFDEQPLDRVELRGGRAAGKKATDLAPEA